MNYKDILKNEISKYEENKLNVFPYEYIGGLNGLVIYNFDEKALDKVVDVSQRNFKGFQKYSSYDRTDILFKAAELLKEKKHEITEIISYEAKKPICFAAAEVERSIQTLKLSAIEASKLEGESINLNVDKNGINRDAFTKFEPLGIVYAVTPFNFPLNLVLHKVGPALAVGNSVIVKPSEKTPFSSFYLKYILEKAGLPKGVMQVVTGDGASVTDILLEYDEIKKVSFTGSVRVGKIIKSKVGLKKLTLELGSTSPVYVSKHNDPSILENIASEIVAGAFSYNGQVCISTQKLYADEEIYDQLINMIVKKTKDLKYGELLDELTDYSDLIDVGSQARLMNWIEEAVAGNAEILTGGKKIAKSIEPTILTNVTKDMKVCTDEIFGPILVVEKIQDSTQLVDKLNASNYGLNVGVFTSNLQEGLNLANELDFGQVLINDVPTLRFDHMPYNGRKNSGYGTEGVKYAIQEMAKRKFISLNYA